MEDRTIVNGCVYIYIYINLYLGGLVILYYSGLFNMAMDTKPDLFTWGFQSLSSVGDPNQNPPVLGINE